MTCEGVCYVMLSMPEGVGRGRDRVKAAKGLKAKSPNAANAQHRQHMCIYPVIHGVIWCHMFFHVKILFDFV